MENQTHILTLVKKLIMKILSLKLVILLEYQNIKLFLQKVTLKSGLKMFLWLKDFKVLNRGLFFINNLNGEEIVRKFYENKCQKTNQKEKKAINYVLNGKDSIIHLTVGSIKQT